MSDAYGGYQDPGWIGAFKALVGRSKSADGLIVLRILFVSLVAASLLILYVLMFLDLDLDPPAPALVLGVIVLSSLGAFVARRVSRQGLDVTSPEKAAEVYRSRFFLAFAINEIPLLIAFVLCFLQDSLWPYLIALPIFLVGMAAIAPGRRNLDSLDRDLMARGATFSLRAEIARGVSASK